MQRLCRQTRMTLLDEIKRTADGLAAIKDWLGEGGHVAQAQADHRSLACLRGGPDGSPCPHNVHARWWESAKNPVADAIKAQLEIKERVRLSTPFDAHLKMCKACGCCIQLKVHAPIHHIKAHTPEETLSKFPAFCWIRREIEGNDE